MPSEGQILKAHGQGLPAVCKAWGVQRVVPVLLSSEKKSRSGFSLPCFSVAGMVTTDINIAMYWVSVAYMVMLRVFVRCMVVWRCAEVANAPCVRLVNAGAYGAVVVLCALASCCSSVVSCGCLVLKNTQLDVEPHST